MTHKIQRYGWKKDHIDKRDIKFKIAKPLLLKLPVRIDLRGAAMPAVYDQEDLGSCTANSVGGICQYEDNKDGVSIPPSRLFVYYNTRAIEGNVPSDSGAEIRNTIKSVNRWGYCDEKLWPYITSKFAVKPNDPAYAKALAERVTSYNRVTQQAQYIKAAVVAKHPVAFGFVVYPGFESAEVARTGVVPMPNPAREDPIGGHAVAVVGYDDVKRWFIVRNSWGPNWGDKGYFYMPYQYVLDRNLSSDFWIVTRMPKI
jgi:C1A family cysteine protease